MDKIFYVIVIKEKKRINTYYKLGQFNEYLFVGDVVIVAAAYSTFTFIIHSINKEQRKLFGEVIHHSSLMDRLELDVDECTVVGRLMTLLDDSMVENGRETIRSMVLYQMGKKIVTSY